LANFLPLGRISAWGREVQTFPTSGTSIAGESLITGQENGMNAISSLQDQLTATAVAVVRSSYDAFAAKDRAAMEALLDEDFHFTSPLDNRIDRQTYFTRCWPNSKDIAEFDLIHVVAEEDKVFVTYVARMKDGRRFRNTEIVTVRGHQITDVEVYFGWSLPHEAPRGSFIETVTVGK
jgi:ketosteroid isomerase-like protein